MTITGLNDYVRNKAAQAEGRILITAFSQKAIAVDGHCWLYANKHVQESKIIDKTNLLTAEGQQYADAFIRSSSQGAETQEGEDLRADDTITLDVRHRLVRSMLDFCLRWLQYQITPVIVFDGQPRPEKKQVRQKRRDKREVDRESLKVSLAELRQGSLFSPDPDLVRRVKNLMKATIVPSPRDIDAIKAVLDLLGVPWMEAKHDAEELCCMLYHEGKVAAVFSKDGDNLAYGCKVLLTNFEEAVNGEHCLRYIAYDKLLEHMEVTATQFIDICIMAGCDFNTNIPSVGFITSIELIKRNRDIEGVSRSYDVSCLCHVECRRIFERKEAKSLVAQSTLRYQLVNKFKGDNLMQLCSTLNALNLGEFYSTYRYALTIWEERNPAPQKRVAIIKKK